MTVEEKLAQAFKETFDERTERVMKIEKKAPLLACVQTVGAQNSARHSLWSLQRALDFEKSKICRYGIDCRLFAAYRRNGIRCRYYNRQIWL